MQVQSVNSKINKTNFGSSSQLDKALEFINMNNSQINQMALQKTNEEQAKKKNYLKSLLITLPLVDTLSKFIMQNGGIMTEGKINFNNKMYDNFKVLPGSLSQKMSAAGHTAMKWGGVILVLGIYNSIKNAVVSKSEKMQNFEKRHPLASMFADLGMFLATLSLAEKGSNKIAEKMINKTPGFIAKVSTKVSNVKSWLDTTTVNTKVLPKISELFGRLSKKAPLLAAAGTLTLLAAPWIVIFNSIVKASKQNREYNAKFLNNYLAIKENQIDTARHISNMLSVSNNILNKDSAIN